MTAAPAGYSRKTATTVAPPAGYSRKTAPAAVSQAELERQATMETDWGPRGLGDNFARAGQSLDDSMRIIADSATRGYGDKAMGPEEQALTDAARERQGWGGTALDVGTTIVTSPYRIANAGWGAAAGGLEGMASEYGHQENWVPSLEDAGKIGWEGAKGAALGSGAAKLGEWIGGWWGGRQAKAARPYKTDAELRAAAVTDPSLAQRAANVEKIRATQGTSRDTFAKMLSGMEGATPEVQARIAAAAKEKSLREAIGTNPVVKKISMIHPNRTHSLMDWMGTAATEAAVSSLSPIPGAVTGTRLLATGLDAWGRGAKNTVPQRSIDELADLVRNGPLQVDPATIDRWRDMTAKIGIGYGRAP